MTVLIFIAALGVNGPFTKVDEENKSADACRAFLLHGSGYKVNSGGPNHRRHAFFKAVRERARLIYFCILLTIHALARFRIPPALKGEHQISPWRFWRISFTRFRESIGTDVSPHIPYFFSHSMMYTRALVAPHSRGTNLFYNRLLFGRLYLADVLKAQGLFADAEFLYRDIARQSKLRGPALAGLGDLLTVQAKWSSDFYTFQSMGIMPNPVRRLQQIKDIRIWHDCSFADAIDVLNQAVEASLNDADIQWLLYHAYHLVGLQNESIAAFRRYKSMETRLSKTYLTFAEVLAQSSANIESWDLAIELVCSYAPSDCKVSTMELINTREAHSNGFCELTNITDGVNSLVKSTIILCGEVMEYVSRIEFPETFIAKYDNATIMPGRGHAMIIAQDKFIIQDSSHLPRIHITADNPQLWCTSHDRALMISPLPTERTEEHCIFLGRSPNYYHWILEDFARFSLILESDQYNHCPILVDSGIATWQLDVFRLFDIDPSRLIKVDFSGPVSFKNLIVPSLLSRDMIAHPAAVAFVRKHLAPHADSSKSKPGKRVFITRKHDGMRKLLNEPDVLTRCSRAGFQMVDTSNMSIEEQIELFSDVEVIAGQGGAGITNMILAPKDARVLIFSASNAIAETYASIASIIGQQFTYCAGTSYPKINPHGMWIQYMDCEINETDLKLCLDRVL